MPSENTLGAAPLLSLADFTSPELLIPHLHARDTAGIVGELSQLLYRHECVPDALPFYQAAFSHALLSGVTTSTGIAFPHARSAGARTLRFALGRTRKPVDWGSSRHCPVCLVFLIAVPATDAVNYLKLLCRLAGLGRQPEFVERLRAARSREEIMTALREGRQSDSDRRRRQAAKRQPA